MSAVTYLYSQNLGSLVFVFAPWNSSATVLHVCVHYGILLCKVQVWIHNLLKTAE